MSQFFPIARRGAARSNRLFDAPLGRMAMDEIVHCTSSDITPFATRQMPSEIDAVEIK
ncbi:MAG TPA: hypothetical protein VGG12_03595 [Methylovirgula sp.]|jgi:hypothetical protein